MMPSRILSSLALLCAALPVGAQSLQSLLQKPLKQDPALIEARAN